MSRPATASTILIVVLLSAGCASQTRTPRPTLSAARIVTGFAQRYASYLAGTTTARRVLDSTAAVRAGLGPPLPAADRHGPLAVASVRSPAQVRTRAGAGTYVVTFADRAHRFLSSVTVRLANGRLLVVALVPPDLDSVLSPNPAGPRPPAGSAAPLAAARRFLAGYLQLIYGHAGLPAVRGLSPALRARLVADPPIATPVLSSRDPRVATVGIDRQGHGWQAKALISDAADTYELILPLTRAGGRWLVANVEYPQ